MRKLLGYYYKKQWYILVVLVIIVCITTIMNLNDDPVWVANNKFIGSDAGFSSFATFGSTFATLIPMFVFSFKMRKINIDQMYSLPIKREKIFLAKFIFGFSLMIIPITIGYLINYLHIISITDVFNEIFFLYYYLVLFLALLAIYTTISFVYTRANTIADGIFMCIMYIFLLVAIVGYICKLVPEISEVDASWFFLYSPITCLTDTFNSFACNFNLAYPDVEIIEIGDIICYVVFGIIAIISFVLFIFLNKKEKAENTSQITESFFGYKVLIPIYVAVLLGLSDDILLSIFTFVGPYFLVSLYKRSFKFKHKYYFVVLAAYVLGILLNIIA